MRVAAALFVLIALVSLAGCSSQPTAEQVVKDPKSYVGDELDLTGKVTFGGTYKIQEPEGEVVRTTYYLTVGDKALAMRLGSIDGNKPVPAALTKVEKKGQAFVRVKGMLMPGQIDPTNKGNDSEPYLWINSAEEVTP